jgi:DNA-binding SARP family transcriptional activator
VNLAEELLFTFLVENPTDEDALCQLMLILAEKERRHEALNIYQYVVNILQDEKREPANYTQSLVHQIQQGLSLQEGRATYTTINVDNLLTFPFIVQVEKGPFCRLLQRLQKIQKMQRFNNPAQLSINTQKSVTVYRFLILLRISSYMAV